jgi:hypothetical protein
MHLHLRYLRAAVLVAHERSEVGLLGWIILGEALDLAVMVPYISNSFKQLQTC